MIGSLLGLPAIARLAITWPSTTAGLGRSGNGSRHLLKLLSDALALVKAEKLNFLYDIRQGHEEH